MTRPQRLLYALCSSSATTAGSLIGGTFHPRHFSAGNVARATAAANIDKDPWREAHKKIWISGLVDPKWTTMYAREMLYAGKIDRMFKELKFQSKNLTHSLAFRANQGFVDTYITWKDLKVNIIDTDNTVELTSNVKRVLHDIDGAILVISSITHSTEVIIQIVNNFMKTLEVPRFFLIDELHQKGANPWKLLKEVRSSLGHNCAAIHVPIGLECDFKGVVDLVQLKAYFFHGDTITIGEVPTNMEALVSDKRQELIETVSKVDDKFNIYLKNNNNPSSADLEESVRRASIAQKFIPVLMGGIYKKDTLWCRLKKTEDLCRIYKQTDKEKLKKVAKDIVHIDVRNLIMTHRLFQHAKRYSSVLALVGRNHMFGMRHYWSMMKQKLLQDGISKEAESFEAYMQLMNLELGYQPTSRLNPKIQP
ncbi:hypothetical protein RYX36_008921 [Vicia faba]